jgi:AbrB family looped-hinge helix DNA binding protein
MVTFNGRITLPTHVRKQLGLKTGDNVEFVEVEKGRFALVHGAAAVKTAEDYAAEREREPVYPDAAAIQ